jgi:ATP-dependent Clp protease ATP-binding subunit ClpB
MVDARHAVFIMTSNLGTEEMGKAVGFTPSQSRKADFTAHLSRFFRPEFLNRIDEVMTFNSLDANTLSNILDLQLQELHERLEGQKLTLILSDEARDYILQRGYDPANGVRHLRRAIERLITRPLSAQIVADKFKQGSVIRADVHDDDQLRFEAE